MHTFTSNRTRPVFGHGERQSSPTSTVVVVGRESPNPGILTEIQKQILNLDTLESSSPRSVQALRLRYLVLRI